TLLEGVAAALAHAHHRGHVDLVEGRQHRGGLLRLHQPPRDRLAAAGHPDALLRAARDGGGGGGGRRDRRRGGRGGGRRGRRRGRRLGRQGLRWSGRGLCRGGGLLATLAGALGFDVGCDVVLGHPPAGAGAGHAVDVDAVLGGDAPGQRRGAGVLVAV